MNLWTMSSKKRIIIDSSIYEKFIDIEEFADSVIIFDDIHVISDRKIRGEA